MRSRNDGVRRALGFALAIGFLVGIVLPVQADAGLETLVAATFGVPRAFDASLHAISHERATFQAEHADGECGLTHEGLLTAEVLACTGAEEPAGRAVELWLASPEHAAILADPDYTRIGCGSVESEGLTYLACALDVELVPGPQTPTPEPTLIPTPAALPDTALEAS